MTRKAINVLHKKFCRHRNFGIIGQILPCNNNSLYHRVISIIGYDYNTNRYGKMEYLCMNSLLFNQILSVRWSYGRI